MKLKLELNFLKALLILAMPFSVFSQKDLNNQPLYGQVKSMYVVEYTAHFDIVGEVYRTAKNYQYELFYNDKGQVVRYNNLAYNQLVSWYNVMIYNDTNQLISKLSFHADSFYMSAIHYNYVKNNLSYWLMYGEDKKLNFGWYNYYDSKGNLIKTESRNSDSIVTRTYEYHYKKGGRLVFEHVFENSNVESKIISKQYNKMGQLTSSTEMIDHKETKKEIFEYNKENLLTKEIKVIPNSDTLSKYYTYNDQRLLTEIKSFFNDSLQETLSYTYKFDSLGNWTTKVRFINGKPDILIDRVIKFY